MAKYNAFTKPLVTCACFLIPYMLCSQQTGAKCNEIYGKAKNLFKDKKYDSALKSLAAVKICDVNLRDKADSLIVAVYTEISKQKQLADTAAERERRQTMIAVLSQKEALRQKDIALKALNEANQNLSKAIGISATRSLLNQNKLEASALLASIWQNNLPLSNEVACSLLRFSPSCFEFIKKGKINAGVNVNYSNVLNWMKQCQGEDLIAISDGNFKVSLYDAKRDKLIPIPPYSRSISGMASSNNSTLLASGGNGIISVDSAGILSALTVPATVYANKIKVSASGRRVLIGATDNRLYSCRNENNQLTITDTLIWQSLNEFDLSRSGNLAVATTYGLQMYTWRNNSRVATDTFRMNGILDRLNRSPMFMHPFVKLSPSANKAGIMLTTTDSMHHQNNLLIVYDTDLRQANHFLFEEEGNSIEGNNYDFTPLGEKIIAATKNAVYVIDAKTAHLNWKVNTNSQLYAIDPKGRFLIITDKNEIVLYGLSSGELYERAVVSKKDITSVLITEDGKKVFVADQNGTVISLLLKENDRTGYIFNQPDQLNKRYAFSTDGNYLLICRPQLSENISWNMFIYDINKHTFLDAGPTPIMPDAMYFKDLSNIVLVFQDAVIGYNYLKDTVYTAFKPSVAIEASAFNYQKQTLVYAGRHRIYEQSLATKKILQTIDIDSVIEISQLLVSPYENKILVVGFTSYQDYRIFEYVSSQKPMSKKIGAKPILVMYNKSNQPVVLSDSRVLRYDIGRTGFVSLNLDIPLPLGTTADFGHNFNGKDFLLLHYRSANDKLLNLIYIDTNTGFTNVISNPAISEYNPVDATLLNISFAPDNSLKTISNCGFLQVWGRHLFKSKPETQAQTNLAVIGSATVPID